jgi:nucleotide-binding universal stress UspA family protein
MAVFSGAGHATGGPSGGRVAHERSIGQPGQHWLDPAHRRVVVGVDGSADSATALVRAASQARQRNATLDVVHVLPDGADARAAILARVMLGEFTRRVCPYGVGAPVRFRVERGNPPTVLLMVSADAELLITGRVMT